MKKIYIVGIGMGNPDTLTGTARKIIETSPAVVGAKRMLDSFPFIGGKKHYAILAQDIFDWIGEQPEETIAVLMSGDVGFFSGAKKLVELFEVEGEAWRTKEAKPEELGLQEIEQKEQRELTELKMERPVVELVPGISSLQYFCAKLCRSWTETKIVSLHGREGNAAAAVQTNRQTFFLTGSDHPVQAICRELAMAGLCSVRVFVGENLSYEVERIVSGTAAALAEQNFAPLSVMLVENDRPVQTKLVSYGFADEDFLRGSVPMTKAEVRSVTLSKLCLCRDDVIYDIGAGTGSVSVEMALMAAEGQVYAIETNETAAALIDSNRTEFEAWNLHVVRGKAPEAMEDLPAPDKAFLGGTKGNMENIIDLLIQKNPRVRVVINAIAIETMNEAMQCLKKYGFADIDVVQLSVARAKSVGGYHMMMGQNPVFIISGQGRG